MSVVMLSTYLKTIIFKELDKEKNDRLQDGRRVRCGDHLTPHKYIRNTPTS